LSSHAESHSIQPDDTSNLTQPRPGARALSGREASCAGPSCCDDVIFTHYYYFCSPQDRLEQPRLLLGETLPPPDNPALTRIQELRAQAQALAKARQEGPPQQTQSRQQQQQQQEQQQQEQKQERERRRRQEKEEEQQQQQQREQQRWEQQYRASEVVVLDDAVPCGGAAGEAVGGGPGGACQDPQTWMGAHASRAEPGASGPGACGGGIVLHQLTEPGGMLECPSLTPPPPPAAAPRPAQALKLLHFLVPPTQSLLCTHDPPLPCTRRLPCFPSSSLTTSTGVLRQGLPAGAAQPRAANSGRGRHATLVK
jgi:hypothetical protein